jgi:hypothetical protein
MTNDASDNQYDTEHVVLWVRWLQFKGLDPAAVRDEVDKWTLGEVTQVYVGQHARTMPSVVVKTIVEHALLASVDSTWPAIPMQPLASQSRSTASSHGFIATPYNGGNPAVVTERESA